MPLRAILAIATALLALLLGAGSAHAVVRFDPPQSLTSGEDAGYFNPRMAVAPDGTTSLAWVKTVTEPGYRAWVQFTRIHPDGSVDPTLTFDAGFGAGTQAHPAVAVDGSGRTLLVYRLAGESVRSVLIGSDGIPGTVRSVGIDEFSNLPSQLAYSEGGHAYGVFGSWVVAFGPDGVAGTPHRLPGGVTLSRLDMSAGPRVIWRTGAPEYVRGPEILSSSLSPDAPPAPAIPVMPKLPGKGYYGQLDVEGGRVLATAVTVSKRGLRRALVLHSRVDGQGEPIRLADAPNPRPNDYRGQVQLARPTLAAGPGDRAIALWTSHRNEGPPRGIRLRGAVLRGDRASARIDGSFAGRKVKEVAAAYSGATPVVVAGDNSYFTASVTKTGRTPRRTQVPGTRVDSKSGLALLPIGTRLRALWSASDYIPLPGPTGPEGIVTSVGRVR